MMTKHDIVKYLNTNKASNFAQYHIDQFILFGSYATDLATEKSDIDIAYTTESGYKIGYSDYLNISRQLEKDLQLKVDLVNFSKMNPIVKLKAQKDFLYV